MTLLITTIIYLLNVTAGNKLLFEKQRDWGYKEIYHIDNDELMLLIKAEAKIIMINENSGDGTFLHKVKFQNTYFMQSTINTISV